MGREVLPPGILVFVYGTLKQGHYNHRWMAGADLLGRGFIHGVLHDLGSYPGLELRPGTHQHVEGEVYETSTLTLGDLDQLEGCPHLYTRQRVKLCTEDGDGAMVWTYVATPATLKRASRGIIPSGVWEGSAPKVEGNGRKAVRP